MKLCLEPFESASVQVPTQSPFGNSSFSHLQSEYSPPTQTCLLTFPLLHTQDLASPITLQAYTTVLDDNIARLASKVHNSGERLRFSGLFCMRTAYDGSRIVSRTKYRTRAQIRPG